MFAWGKYCYIKMVHIKKVPLITHGWRGILFEKNTMIAHITINVCPPLKKKKINNCIESWNKCIVPIYELVWDTHNMHATEWSTKPPRMVTMTKLMCGCECMPEVISKHHILSKLMKFEIWTMLNKTQMLEWNCKIQ